MPCWAALTYGIRRNSIYVFTALFASVPVKLKSTCTLLSTILIFCKGRPHISFREDKCR
jgi:hypothetical protein